MTKQMKKHLEAVVEAIIFDDAAAAKDAFHNYLSLKTQSILVGEAAECADGEDESEMKDEKKSDEEDKSEDKKDDKPADEKKDDKKSDEKKDKKDEGDEE